MMILMMGDNLQKIIKVCAEIMKNSKVLVYVISTFSE